MTTKKPENINIDAILDKHIGLTEELNELLKEVEQKGIMPTDLKDLLKQSINLTSSMSFSEEQLKDYQKKQLEIRDKLLKIIASSNFRTIRQNNTTNALTKFRAGNNMKLDKINDKATITQGDFSLMIENYTKTKGLKTSTLKMFDIFVIIATENGMNDRTVKMSLSDFMAMRGLKDRKHAKTQAISDLELVKSASFTAQEISRGKKVSYKFVNLATAGEIAKNGNITFSFSPEIFEVLKNAKIMPYHKELLKLDDRKYTSSYFLGRKILELKNNNFDKPNVDTLTVAMLLKNSPYIPTFEEVANTDRAFERRIVEPFQDNMNHLQDNKICCWEYCHKGGLKLTDDEYNNISELNFNDWLDLRVKILWNEYPDMTQRAANKAEKVAKASELKKKKENAKIKALASKEVENLE